MIGEADGSAIGSGAHDTTELDVRATAFSISIFDPKAPSAR
jgi:hypothetical protein